MNIVNRRGTTRKLKRSKNNKLIKKIKCNHKNPQLKPEKATKEGEQ